MGKQIDIFGKVTEPPTFFEENYEDIKKGFEGENDIREFLKRRGIRFLQADVIFEHKGKYYCGEVKTQYKATPEQYGIPFEGHGLPPWQIKARIRLYEKTGILPYLFVRCLSDNCIYYEDLRKLMNTKYYEFKKTPRIVFNLEEFRREELE
jgi:hypothetical protein